MILNQWYAVLSSSELKNGKVLGARRFGHDIVFFRKRNGEIACLDSACAHRKAALSKGWVEDDCIKCPFHGIEYDATGKCVYIPSEGKASSEDLSRFHMKSYPVREIGGIVFAWYGESTPTTEPDVFDIIRDDSYTYDHVDDTWAVDYSRVIENQLDVSHLPFVHHNTIGRGNKTLCNGPKVEWLDDHTLRTSANNEIDVGQKPKSAENSEIKSTNLTFKFPNMWLNHVTDKIQILAYFVPVDDEHSIISLRFYNKITGIKAIDKAIAWLGSRANKIVERQDKRVVETQLPKKTGPAIGESLVAADLPIISYRTKRHELQEMSKPRNTSGTRNRDESRIQEGTNTMDKKAMYKLSYGLFVLTAAYEGKANGCIINTAMQLASEPKTISVAINKANYTHDMVMKTGCCNVSVISTEAGFELFKHFGFQSGKDVDKFKDYPIEAYSEASNGIPYITAGINAYFSLKVKQMVDLGSHTLFLCEPTAMEVVSDASSCTYEYYLEHIKEKPQAVGKSASGKTIWRCVICGYEWEGEELPDDFICPICKHPKADFEKIVVQ